jgi:putative ABC transport system ATP-binding protein
MNNITLESLSFIMIRLVNVVKSYGDLTVLKNVSLQINGGDYITIMGKSGAGKSTLISILGLMDRPSSGSYELDGQNTVFLLDEEVARLRNEEFGFVFQGYNLISDLTVEENILIPVMYSRKKRVDEQYLVELLTRLDIMHLRKKIVNKLSGGEKQRVAIARALINRPATIIADEPTGSLDQVNRDAVLQIFRELNQEGITIIVVTHDQTLTKDARKVYRLSMGHLL